MRNKSKKMKKLKRFVCLTISILLSFNTFAAVVSDNDGSAFITKAEYDSLKNNFQSQLDSYVPSHQFTQVVAGWDLSHHLAK